MSTHGRQVAVAPLPAAATVDHEACRGTARIVAQRELRERLANLPAWAIEDGKLQRRLHFESFPAAFEFVTGVALLAERRNHHPGIHVEKRDVEVTLWTRKMGAVTTLDVEFAEAVEYLMETRL